MCRLGYSNLSLELRNVSNPNTPASVSGYVEVDFNYKIGDRYEYNDCLRRQKL